MCLNLELHVHCISLGSIQIESSYRSSDKYLPLGTPLRLLLRNRRRCSNVQALWTCKLRWLLQRNLWKRPIGRL